MAAAALAAVIFDFDGLLMATESTMLASWQYEWRQHGLELDTATFWADHGGDVSQERYRLLAEAVGPPTPRPAATRAGLPTGTGCTRSWIWPPAWAAGWTRPPRPGSGWRWPAARRSGGCATT